MSTGLSQLSPRSVRVAGLVLFLVAGLLVWGRTFGYGFVWDDEYFIVSNTAIRSLENIPAFFTDESTMAGRGRADDFAIFRPLRNVSYALDFRVAGLNPAWWHIHQVLLHLAASLLVWRLGTRLTGRAAAGWVAGMVFLLHPVQTEVVAWVKCRDDILSVLFSLLAFLLWARHSSAGWNPASAAALCGLYLGACLAKEQAVVLPLLLFAYDAWTGTGACAESGSLAGGARAIARRRAGLACALAATGVMFLAWRHVFIGRTSQIGYLTGSWSTTLLTMVEVPLRYLQLLVLPVNLRADYSDLPVRTSLFEPPVLLALVLLAAVAAGLLSLRKRLPLATFGLAWVFLALLPMSNVVPMMQFMAERFLYLPMVGFALAAGDLTGRALERRGARAWLVRAPLLAAFGVLTFQRLAVWKDGETLYRQTVADTGPEAVRARRNFLRTLVARGASDEAFLLARELYDRHAARTDVPPSFSAEFARHLGYLYWLRGREEEGRRLLEEAMARDPGYSQPFIDLGVFAGRAGRHGEALGWFDKAVAAKPSDASAHYNRGLALQALGRSAEAEAAFREATRVGPDQPEAFRELGAILWNSGRHEEAAALFAQGAQIWPDDAFFKEWAGISRKALKARPAGP